MDFRVTSEMRNQRGFIARFAWFMSTYFSVIILAVSYVFYGTAFALIDKEYQFVLALASPFIKDFFTKLILEVAYRSAGEGSRGKKTIKIPIAHYMTTKHTVFLAIIVGGVAVPQTTYTLLAIDFVKAIYEGLKILKKAKASGGQDKAEIEGKFHLSHY